MVNIATAAIKPYPETASKFKNGRPGYKWYAGFMRRNRRHVRAKFARDVDATRENWATYENFSGWYEFLAGDLVEIGLADPNPDWVGRDPPATATARQRQRVIIKDPSRFIFMDESAVKLDMCDDRERGAKAKVVGAASGEARRRVGKSSERITIAPAFLGDGRNLPLTVIWKSKRGTRAAWRDGRDGRGGPSVPHPFVEGETLDTMHFYNKSGGMTCEMLDTVIKTCWMPVLEKVSDGLCYTSLAFI